MIYLKNFNLLDGSCEEGILGGERRTYINNQYPFRIFPQKEFKDIEFDTITIFYGENGSGKSTVLNIIAETINARRNIQYAKGESFINYIKLCKYNFNTLPMDIKIISSDDVFDYLFNIRRINHGTFSKREEIFKEYFKKRNARINSFSDYQEIVDSVDAKKNTLSGYMRKKVLAQDVQEQSNGESALMFFISEIKENSIYILDEPENSMSASMQMKFAKFIEESARFFNCQFIISTHSPFLLSINGAKIYDLDSKPVINKKWYELENIKSYYNLFHDNENFFKN